ncbi:MAG: CPBP family intramembrane metalloprotease [Chlamydiia bacterium]|nr:CPBP family intramembrane metalloprotease [Chlamydiia bacterium]
MKATNQFIKSLLSTLYLVLFFLVYYWGKTVPLKAAEYLAPGYFDGLFDLDFGRMGLRVSCLLSLLALYFAAELLLFRRPLSRMSLRWQPGFAWGAAIGALMVMVTIGLTLVTGAVVINGFELAPIVIAGTIGSYVLAMSMTAFTEELLLRGILLDGLAREWGATAAVWITAILFGVLHWPAGGTYAIMALLLGLFLGYAYLDRGLYWCIGWHFAWNSIESIFYSGSIVHFTVLDTALAGARQMSPDRLGWLVLPVVVVGLIVYLLWAPTSSAKK